VLSYHDRWVLRAEPFLFARFENAPSESEEALESRVEVLPGGSHQTDKPSPSQPPPAAFDNPMYGNTKVRKPNVTYENRDLLERNDV
jgi:hypothetical protein